MTRTDVSFRSGDAECAAWLYDPDGSSGADAAPCVVLAHGFGAVKEARLDAYAERFAAAGYFALVFDYRHFGASGGDPRQLVDIARQHEDWRAALAHARGLAGVDGSRIALWGSSFSGGHVIAVAADDPRVAAVVSQAPHVDGLATMRAAGAADLARMTAAGLRDQLGGIAGRDPYLAPIVAAPGKLGAMTSPDAKPGYASLFPKGFEWRNEVAARVFLRIGAYSPIRKAKLLRCPLLVQVASDDAVTPPDAARKAARRAPRGELREYACGHFEIYLGETFERVVADQLEYLDRAFDAGS